MLRERNLNGESITTLATEFDVGRKAVTASIARGGGGKDRTGSYTFTVDKCRELRVRNEAGETVTDIAMKEGAERATVSRAIRSVGGKPNFGPRRGPRIIGNDGYAKVMIDRNDVLGMPMAQGRARHTVNSGVYVLEHRLVLARKLGRALLPHETVHHKDGDRLNNHPDNLELRVGRHGKGATTAHCVTCRCFAGAEGAN